MKISPSSSWWSAGIFIVVTLWAFGNLQNSGPEGTLRRFFELSGNNNIQEINRLLVPAEERVENLTPPELFLLKEANRIGSVGYRVLRIRQADRVAVVEIQSEDPSLGVVTTTWVLARPSLRWTVDLKSTVMAQS